MLLLLTFDEPSSGSRTTEKRPRPTSFTSPISSDATWATRFDSRHASTKRSFIQTSSSSCCSPYTLRLAAGSLRIGSSRRMRVTSPANRDNSRPRSRSTFPACSASRTSRRRRPSVLDVPSLEVVLQLLFSTVEVPPRTAVPVGEVRERLEIPHSLRPHIFHLRRERLLSERILPNRAAREEPGCAALARDLDEPSEHGEVGPGAQHDPGHFRRAAQAVAVLAEILGARRHLRVAGELRLQHVDSQRTEGLCGPDDRVGLVVGERLLALVHRIRHRLAHEREVETPAFVRDRLAELHRLHLRIRRGLRILRMEHLLEAPPLVHRDHREPPRGVRNLLEAAELADRNSHSCHPDTSQTSRTVLTFAEGSADSPSGEALKSLFDGSRP